MSRQKLEPGNMKICLVTNLYPGKTQFASGVGTYVKALAEGLSECGQEVHVLLLGVPENRTYSEKGITFHEVYFKTPKFMRMEAVRERLPLEEIYQIAAAGNALSRIVERYRIDIVEQINYGAFALFYLNKRKRAPVVTRISTTAKMGFEGRLQKLSKKQRILCWLEKQLYKRSDYLISNSRAHLAELREQYGDIVRNAEVIFLGTELRPMTARRASADQITALYVGHFQKRKGIDVLLSAIPAALEREPKLRFVLIGRDFENKYEKEFRARTGDRFKDQVLFLGQVSAEDLRRHYEQMDFLVVPSRYESFGLIITEAMSYAKPVIGCPVGGMLDIIVDNVTGLFAEAGNADDLTDKIVRLAADAQLRERLGSQGLERIREFFSVEKMVSGTLDLYVRAAGFSRMPVNKRPDLPASRGLESSKRA